MLSHVERFNLLKIKTYNFNSNCFDYQMNSVVLQLTRRFFKMITNLQKKQIRAFYFRLAQ